MSANALEVILAYATIPLYVIGLLLLVYAITRSQLGGSPFKQMKSAVKNELSLKPSNVSAGAYIMVMILLGLYILLTVTTQRGQHQ